MHDEEEGLQRDLKMFERTVDRRQLLSWLGIAAAAAPLAACAERAGLADSDDSFWDTAGGGDPARRQCTKIPEETAGPYPGDGSNGPNALSLNGIVRSDIRTSVGAASGTAAGVIMRMGLRIVDANCQPIQGAAVYVWHCDRAGQYSLYNITTENYLRGVQVTDANGRAMFTSIFPGCYSGRWPHVHFEVYPTVASITSSANKIATSQFALPQATCNTVYATAGYSQSATNLSRITLAGDNVFRDGVSLQMPTITGDATNGYNALLRVSVRT